MAPERERHTRARPAIAIALPASVVTVSRSPSVSVASATLTSGEDEMTMLAVPAGTWSSPALTSSWYADIPKSSRRRRREWPRRRSPTS